MRKIYIIILITSLLSQVSISQCLSGDCLNGSGKFKFKTGDLYEGQFINGKPDGKGKLKLTNGTLYSGEWKSGKKEGKMVIKYTDETKLFCYYKNDMKNGDATLTDKNNNKIAYINYKDDKELSRKKISNATSAKGTGDPGKAKTDGKATKKVDETKNDLKSSASVSQDKNNNNTEKKKIDQKDIPGTTVPVKIKELNIGDEIKYKEYYSYNTGDGSFFGNIVGSYLAVKYEIEYTGIIEQKLGKRYKITIMDGRIIDPSWASINYVNYKQYASKDMNSKIGTAVFKTAEEVIAIE